MSSGGSNTPWSMGTNTIASQVPWSFAPFDYGSSPPLTEVAYGVRSINVELYGINIKPDTWYQVQFKFYKDPNIKANFYTLSMEKGCSLQVGGHFTANTCDSFQLSGKEENNTSVIITAILKANSSAEGIAFSISGGTSSYKYALFYNSSLVSNQGIILRNVEVKATNDMSGAIEGMIGKQEETNQAIKNQTEESKKQHEENKGFFANIIDSIKNLPGKLFDSIKGLFVPDGDELNELMDNFKKAINDKLGAVGQVITLTTDFITGIDWTGSSGSLTFPEISVMGYTIIKSQSVQVIPEGFSFLQDTLKIVVDIVVTLAFINMLRRKYEGFVGGDSSDY